MRAKTPPGVSSYLADTHSIDLLKSLSRSLGIRIAVLDPNGLTLFDSGPKGQGIPKTQAAESVPIGNGPRNLGSIVLSAGKAAAWGKSQQARTARLAQYLARVIGDALQAEEKHRQLTESLSLRHEQIDLLHRFSREMVDEEATTLAYEPLLEGVAAMMPESYLMVSLMSRGFTHLKGSIAGLPGDKLAGNSLPWEDIGVRLLSECLQSEVPWVRLGPGTLPDLEQACNQALDTRCIPIRVEERAVGFVALLRSARQGSQEPARMDLLKGLADHIASALGTVQLRSELQGFLFNTVKSLVAAVDAKDQYTRGHSERVHYLAVRAGEVMGLDLRELQSLSWAALLHDIGKISIPGAILSKPDAPSPEEWKIIRTHPDRGCEVIEPIPQLSRALPGIRHHHERFDGSGYPARLAGADIPLQARIISASDTFDAITSDRPYLLGSSCEEALAILAKGAGRLFDPDVVAAVRTVVKEEIATGSIAFEALRRPRGEDHKAA